MKRTISILLTILLIAGLCGCGQAADDAPLEESVLATAEPTPAPTSAPTPEPTPSVMWLTQYAQLKDGDRAELEEHARGLIRSRVSNYTTMTYSDDFFQPRGVYGTQNPRLEYLIAVDPQLDSAYVLRAKNTEEEAQSRVILLFETFLSFNDPNLARKLNGYFAVSAENIALEPDGTADLNLDSAEVCLVLDKSSYTPYDMYEELVLTKADAYEIDEAILSDEHEERFSRVNLQAENIEHARSSDSYSYYLVCTNNRRMIEADLRGMTAFQLEVARNEIYWQNGVVCRDPRLEPYYENSFHRMTSQDSGIEPEDFDESTLNAFERYNIDFIKKHEEALAASGEETVGIAPPAQTAATPEPERIYGDGLAGTWELDISMTVEANGSVLAHTFGTMINGTTPRLTLTEHGECSFSLAASGGEGTFYTEADGVFLDIIPYEGAPKTYILARVSSPVDGTDRLKMTIFEDTYAYWMKVS